MADDRRREKPSPIMAIKRLWCAGWFACCWLPGSRASEASRGPEGGGQRRLTTGVMPACAPMSH